MRIAMWSGPRNISTAMLRAWGNRPDAFVCDEPLYANYLKQTGKPHPGAAEVIEHHESDVTKVIQWLTGPVPDGRAIFYQKHMAHHMLPQISRDWLGAMEHCFLIRDPREMITSLLHNVPDADINDTGLPQQVELFDRVRKATGKTPPVLDSKLVLQDPRHQLQLVCDALQVVFSDRMLEWPAGRRSTDGIWARYWYDRVDESTGFAKWRPKPDAVPDSKLPLYNQCLDYYQHLSQFRLK